MYLQCSNISKYVRSKLGLYFTTIKKTFSTLQKRFSVVCVSTFIRLVVYVFYALKTTHNELIWQKFNDLLVQNYCYTQS